MKISIVAIGQRLPTWAGAAVKDYLKRLPADFKVELKELKAEPRSSNSTDASRVLTAEALRIRAAVPPAALTVALDERGRDWTTAHLAEQLGHWRDDAQAVAFVIGGADGLDATLKREASYELRLSSMTLPHALARVMLVEQIYRAWTLLTRHPYHRA